MIIASNLYSQIEKDFVSHSDPDSWNIPYIVNVTDNFQKRSVGLMYDWAPKINEVFTSVFLSSSTIEFLKRANLRNSLLVTHHPLEWTMNKYPNIFTQISPDQENFLKYNNISTYVIHTALDRNSEFSTATAFMEVFGWIRSGEFVKRKKGFYGLICTVPRLRNTDELATKISDKLGHVVSNYMYGESEINNGKVGLLPGGTNDISILEELAHSSVNVLVTGVSKLTERYSKFHNYAKDKRISIIGATHYSTEKFACIKLVEYFRRLNIRCEFIPEIPQLEDL